jgi:hypothetical protein
MRRVLTNNSDIQFIRKNYLKFSSRELGRILKVSRYAISRFLRRENLKVPIEISKQFKAKAVAKRYDSIIHPADELIKELYLQLPLKNIADLIDRTDSYVSGRYKKLNLKVPYGIKQEFIEYSRMKKGNIPFSKGKKQTEFMSPEAIERTKNTRFKKGNSSPNTLYDGAITQRKDKREISYKYIRIAPGKWKELQIYNWEKKNGPVPKGYVLACKDGNTLNCKPSNWYLLTKADNARRNSIHNYPKEIVDTVMLLGRMKKKDQIKT